MTYTEVKEMIESAGFDTYDLPITAVNEHFEPVIIQAEYVDKDLVYKLITSQDNGYLRTNCYWPDGTVEELFEH